MKALALTLEAVLTGHGYADLDASPLQLAVARAADGRDLEGALPPAAMRAHFGVDELPLLSVAAIDRCTRKAPADLPWEEGHYYTAAMDAATRGNSWTLVIATRNQTPSGLKDVIVCTRQWTGSKTTPLDPKAVLLEIASVLKRYRLDYVWADEYGSDFVRRLAYDCDVSICLEGMTAAQKVDRYQGLALQLAHGDIELPPDEVIRRDLLGIKKVARQGSIAIVLPHTPDGRHADYAPAIVMALHKRAMDPDPPKPKPGTREYYAAMERELEESMLRSMEERYEAKRAEASYWRDFYGLEFEEERRR
jgi:hypothetical protein